GQLRERERAGHRAVQPARAEPPAVRSDDRGSDGVLTPVVDPDAALPDHRRGFPDARVQVRALRGREDLRAPAQAGHATPSRSIEPMKQQAHTVTTAGIAAVLAVSAGAEAQDRFRTAWGEPDISGVYSEYTTAPLERDPALGEKEFFTPEEHEAFVQQRLSQQFAADDTEPGTQADVHYSMELFSLSEYEGVTTP